VVDNSRAVIGIAAGLLAAASLQFAATPARAAVACTLIRTPAQLQAIQSNLNGVYCLANDIDLASIANFTPIGDLFGPFTGRFFGNNHVIRNLTVNTGAQQSAGLFGGTSGAVIEDVSLINANVVGSSGSGYVGGLVGYFEFGAGSDPGRLSNVHVSGKVKCTGDQCIVGGIAGVVGETTTLTRSSSSATVTGKNGWAGGAVGWVKGTVSWTSATGNVACLGASGSAGGLAAAILGTGSVNDSFAVGAVSGVDNCNSAGGLVGGSSGTIQRAFATGAVHSGTNTSVGGLVGWIDSGTVSESYSVGKVSGGAGATVGGFAGHNSGTVSNSYWNTNTSGTASSAAGTGLTTAQLRTALPTGFGASWAIAKALSFPFLNDFNLDFASPLATLVRSNRVYAFLPIGQLDVSQYSTAPAHADAASKAAVYTMIARAIGITRGVAALKNATISTYWNDATQTATWSGPVTTYATMGSLVALGTAPMNSTNVLGALKQQQLVILRGSYTISGVGTGTHWMLATMYTPNVVIANDPWTGAQVMINAATKTVVAPSGFPLANFKVNAFQPVTVN